MIRQFNGLVVVCAGMAMGLASSANAAVITPGLYSLHNHPDGAERQPLYGMRLDELVNVTNTHDIFTFDFDHAQSNMTLNYTGSSIVISGQAWGGRDTGSAYANDIHQGLYTINFTYSMGVQSVPGDDDIWVDAMNHVNTGTILRPNGSVVSLVDENMMMAPSFRFGDEDNEQGHRGHNGISGWGWMSYASNTNSHIESCDWLFTAVSVPTPGAAATLALGALAGLRRRRK